jgi:hypothetical protein
MGKINVGRLILGGLVAGIVSDLLDYPIDGVWLAGMWNNQLAALGKAGFSANQMIWFNILGLLGGIASIWVYAAIRPRFGAGVKTAIYAGIAVWFIGTLLPNLAFMYVGGLFSKHLTVFTTVGALVEVVVGTILGAALYKEA